MFFPPWYEYVWVDPVWKQHHGNEIQPSWHFLPLVSAVSPCTATEGKVIGSNLCRAHHEKRLNADHLWRFWPIEEALLEREQQGWRFACWVVGGYGDPDSCLHVYLPHFVTGGWGEYEPLDDRLRMIVFYERERLNSNLRLLTDLVHTLTHAGWLAAGPSPLEILALKRRGPVVSVRKSSRRAARVRLEAVTDLKAAWGLPHGRNLMAISRAIRKLVEAMLELWPWSSSPVIMSVRSAYSKGLSQVEHAIWFDLFVACASLHDPRLLPELPGSGPRPELRTEGPKADIRYAGMTFARLCALALVHAPFVDIMHLNRGYYGVELTSRFFPWLADEGRIARRGISTAVSTEAVKVADWAHSDCDRDHYRCQFGRWPEDEVQKLRAFREHPPKWWSNVAIGNQAPWWLGLQVQQQWAEAAAIRDAEREAAAKAAQCAMLVRLNRDMRRLMIRIRDDRASEEMRSRQTGLHCLSRGDDGAAATETTPALAQTPIPAPNAEPQYRNELLEMERQLLWEMFESLTATLNDEELEDAWGAFAPYRDDDGDAVMGDEAATESNLSDSPSPPAFHAIADEDSESVSTTSDLDDRQSVLFTPSPEPDLAHEPESPVPPVNPSTPASNSSCTWFVGLPSQHKVPMLAFPDKRVEMEFTTSRVVDMGENFQLALGGVSGVFYLPAYTP